MIIGLTGGIGSGKSTVSKIFAEHGVTVISADEITHQILDTNPTIQQAIIKKFGPDCLTTNNTINRSELRKIVFKNPQHKIWLEKLLHPLIADEFIAKSKLSSYPYCIIEIPLLIESDMQKLVDRILVVDCPEELQLKMASSRGKHKESEIKEIIANQITREKRLEAANDVIQNTSDFNSLRNQVQTLHLMYLKLSTSR